MEEGIKIVISADSNGFDQAVSSAERSLQKFKKTGADSTQVLVNLSRVAQDAPYGFIGIANNLNPLLESFQRLKVEAGSSKVALQSLVAGLTGPAGLGLALGLISSLMISFGNRTQEAAEKTVDAVKDIKSATDAMTAALGKGGGLADAIANVDELTIHIGLAKDGFLDKDKVVNEYNSTIGKTTGLVKSLDEAEQALAQNAQAYIRFTLLKAAANLALEDAAKKTLEATRQSLEPIKAKIDPLADPNALGTKLINSLKGVKQASEDILKNQANQSENIAKDLLNQATEIAKKFKFNFFGDNKEIIVKPDKVKVQAKDVDLSGPLKNINLIPITGTPLPSFAPRDPQHNNITDRPKEFNKDLQAIGETINGILTPAFEGLFSAITSGQNPLKAFFQSIGQAIERLISQLIAAAVEALILSAITGGVGGQGFKIGGTVAKGFGSIFKGLAHFAEGGVVTRPTLAVMGEGGESEAIIPFSKLPGLIGKASGNGNVYLSGQLAVSGDQLIALIKRTDKKQGRLI